MKTIKIFVLIAILSLGVSACTEDFTNPANLVGTTWKATDVSKTVMASEFDYMSLKFTSKTNVDSYYKLKTETSETSGGSATYSISGKTITFTNPGGTSGGSGTIDGKTLTLTQEGVSLVFTKQ